MRGLVVILMVTAAGAASASEGEAPLAEASELPAASTAAVPDPVPAAADAVAPRASGEEVAAAEAEPAGPSPKLRFVDVAVDLAKARHPARRADLYAALGPPAVVADGFGLLVERRFGR